MTDTPDTSPEAPPKDFWTRDDTIKQVIAKMEAKKERRHDLSGVHYEPDQDCRMAMWVIEALSAKLQAAEAARQDAMLRLSEMRMCVNCGRKTGVDHNRHMPLPDCPSPDACTFDLTPDEAWQHWRQKAHDERARADAAEAEALDWRAQVGELSDKLKALAAERDALQARADAAEADLELEGEWAVIQPNADPMQDPRVKALVEAAQSAHDMLAGCLFANMRVKGQYLIRRDVVSELHAALRDMEQGNT